MHNWQRYIPASVFGAGCLLVGLGSKEQRAVPLAAPLASLPRAIDGEQGTDRIIGPDEQRVAGMSSYLLRAFQRGSTIGFTVYVGYYERQVQGKTIHSPKNCLPGAGWQVVNSAMEHLPTTAGTVPVNRYLLVNGQQRAMVYYWYQGRGRVEADEYRVKLQLLRDSALRGRSEEALVRVVVPVEGTDSAAAEIGRRVSRTLVPDLFRVLPS